MHVRRHHGHRQRQATRAHHPRSRQPQDRPNLQLAHAGGRAARRVRARCTRFSERDLDPAARRGRAVHWRRRRQHRRRARPGDPLGHRGGPPERHDRHFDPRARHPNLRRSLVRAVRAPEFHRRVPAPPHRRPPENRCARSTLPVRPRLHLRQRAPRRVPAAGVPRAAHDVPNPVPPRLGPGSLRAISPS